MKHSNRFYHVTTCEGGSISEFKMPLSELMNDAGEKYNDYEVIFALHEILDQVLDLKQGQSLYFQPNRDDKESKGIILRTK